LASTSTFTSVKNAKYLYFYLSTQVQYFGQHWSLCHGAQLNLY